MILKEQYTVRPVVWNVYEVLVIKIRVAYFSIAYHFARKSTTPRKCGNKYGIGVTVVDT